MSPRVALCFLPAAFGFWSAAMAFTPQVSGEFNRVNRTPSRSLSFGCNVQLADCDRYVQKRTDRDLQGYGFEQQSRDRKLGVLAAVPRTQLSSSGKSDEWKLTDSQRKEKERLEKADVGLKKGVDPINGTVGMARGIVSGLWWSVKEPVTDAAKGN